MTPHTANHTAAQILCIYLCNRNWSICVSQLS